MTIQIRDKVYYKGLEHLLYTEVLERGVLLPPMMGASTVEHKGYAAVWSVVAGLLYLTSFRGTSSEHAKDYVLEDIFPKCDGPVPASWYSGTVKLQRGEVFEATDVDDSLHEYETVLTLDQGRVTDSREARHDPPPLRRTMDPLLLRPIEELDLEPPGLVEALRTAGIHRVGDLVILQPEHFIGLDHDVAPVFPAPSYSQ